MKNFQDSLAKYYQDNKERLQKRLAKNMKVFPKKKESQQHGRELFKNPHKNERQSSVYKKIL